MTDLPRRDSRPQDKNVTILSGINQPALVGGINCAVRRGVAGWQGTLMAESLGPEMIPLTHVQIGFSSELQGTRVAEFRCNIKEGTIFGNGWCSNEGLTALDLQVDSLHLASIAPVWCNNAISGVVSGYFSYKGDPIRWQSGTIVGNFVLKDSALKFGTVSRMVSLLSGTASNGTIQLDSASATLTMTPEQWTLSQISMKKADILELKGTLSCDYTAKLNADLKLGISSQFPLSHGHAASPDEQTEKLQWTTLRFETTPDQLWQGILTALLTPAQPSDAAQSVPQKPALKEKAKAAVDAMMNILNR